MVFRTAFTPYQDTLVTRLNIETGHTGRQGCAKVYEMTWNRSVARLTTLGLATPACTVGQLRLWG